MIWGCRWKEIGSILEVLNLKCLWDIQVKITIKRWEFKHSSRAPDLYFQLPTVISGELFNSGPHWHTAVG